MSIAACTRTVRVPVPVVPAPCLTEPAPRPPDGARAGDDAFARWLVRLLRWSVETEQSCGPEEWRAPADEPVGHYGG